MIHLGENMIDHKVDLNDPMPRYYQIYIFLLDQIRSGEFPPGSAIPTERDLGKIYGVSRITVIKSLDMLEREGYVIRQQGRGTFVSNSSENKGFTNGLIATPTFAFISFSLGHSYISDMLVGIAGTAARQNHSLHVFGSVSSSLDEVNAINDAIHRGVQGIIVNPWREYRNAPFYADLLARNFPVVFVDRYYAELATDYVIYENEQAGYDVTTTLIKQGHKRIAFIPSQEQQTTSVRQRLNGYRRALEAHGLTYDENLIWSDMPSTFFSDNGSLSRTPVTDKLIRSHLKADKPTVLLAANIDVAELLIDAFCSATTCVEREMHSTSDLAIATFDHRELPVGTPLVSVLALHFGETLGAAAAEAMIGRLSGKLPAEPQRLRLPMSIRQLSPHSDTLVRPLPLR